MIGSHQFKLTVISTNGAYLERLFNDLKAAEAEARVYVSDYGDNSVTITEGDYIRHGRIVICYGPETRVNVFFRNLAGSVKVAA